MQPIQPSPQHAAPSIVPVASTTRVSTLHQVGGRFDSCESQAASDFRAGDSQAGARRSDSGHRRFNFWGFRAGTGYRGNFPTSGHRLPVGARRNQTYPR
jgi:hypothetical protein